MAFLTAEKIKEIQESRPGGNYFATKTIPDNDSIKVRFLGNGIAGVGGWVKNKPVRFEVRPTADEFDMSTLDETIDFQTKQPIGPGKLKDFIASVLYNYETESIQIFEITQVSIQNDIFDLMNNNEWGDVTQYDVSIKKVVQRVGSKDRTNYKVIPSPAGMGKLSAKIQKQFDETFVDLTKLYSGDDPFKVG